MTTCSHARADADPSPRHAAHRAALPRNLVIGLIAFLTLVDLFATQAILPSLARAYGVSPAAMGFAVNASTIGMAVAGLAGRVLQPPDRPRAAASWSAWPCCRSRRRCWRPPRTSPPSPRCASRKALHVGRVHADARLSRRALQRRGRRRRLRRLRHRQCRQQPVRPAAVGGGRRPSRPGRQLLRLRRAQPRRCRAGLFSARRARRRWPPSRRAGSPLAPGREHLRNRAAARAASRIGFLILFAFIGTFTYVNFVLARAPLAVEPDGAGLRLLRLPAVDLDHAAGRPGRRAASAPARPSGLRWASPAPACRCCSRRACRPCSLGLALVGVGTFFAQATATGFVGRAATADRGSASGIYLACYFFGGLVGTAVLGQVFDRSAGRLRCRRWLGLGRRCMAGGRAENGALALEGPSASAHCRWSHLIHAACTVSDRFADLAVDYNRFLGEAENRAASEPTARPATVRSTVSASPPFAAA